jgi:hypothetical protein
VFVCSRRFLSSSSRVCVDRLDDIINGRDGTFKGSIVLRTVLLLLMLRCGCALTIGADVVYVDGLVPLFCWCCQSSFRKNSTTGSSLDLVVASTSTSS